MDHNLLCHTKALWKRSKSAHIGADLLLYLSLMADERMESKQLIISHEYQVEVGLKFYLAHISMLIIICIVEFTSTLILTKSLINFWGAKSLS